MKDKLYRSSLANGLLRFLLLLLLILVAAGSAHVYAQRRPASKRPSEPQAAVTFDTLLATDSYKIYGEVRGVGQVVRSEGAKDLLDPFLKLASPPKEFRSLVKWLDARADSLMMSRLLFAAWPSRTKLPNALVAIEFPSNEEAEKFEPQLKEFLPKLLPAPTPEKSATANQSKREEPKQADKPLGPSFILKRSGSLVFITSSPFAVRNLRPQGSKVLAEDENFRLARDRFSTDPVFLYIDFSAISKEEEDRRRRSEEAYQKMQANRQARSELETPPPPPVAPSGLPEPEVTLTDASPDPNAKPDTDRVVIVGSEQGNINQAPAPDLSFDSLLGAFFGVTPKWPEGVGISLVFEGDSYIVRGLLLNSYGGKGNHVPFIPVLAPGPALTLESPAVLPADSELLVAASLDFAQIHEDMLEGAKTRFEQMQKYRPQSSVINEPVSPFEQYEKRFGINIKEDLLPLLGNEVAVALPARTAVVDSDTTTTSQSPSPLADDKPKSAQSSSEPLVAISIKDREAVKRLIPRIIDSLGLKGASLLATTEKRDDTELVSYANVVSYAFIGNFLIGSPDADTVRRAVEAYLNHKTLASDNNFRNHTRWQPRQLLGHTYVSPAFMERNRFFASSEAASMSDQLRDFLALVNPTPQPVTYAMSNEGIGPLHELHIPKDVLLLMVAAMSTNVAASPLITNEAIIQNTMQTLASAEASFKATEGDGRYGTVEELLKAGLISKELLNHPAYRIELFVSHARFEITAVPNDYGNTGRRSFFLDESRVMRAGDHGGGAATVADKPAQ
jgi:hypothetical protein